MCKEYNGWTNYETWNVKLWIDNDEDAHNNIRNIAMTIENAYALSLEIKKEIEDNNPLIKEASMYSDMLTSSLKMVNWIELAKAFMEEV